MKKTFQKSLAVLAAASVCSSMLLNFPSGTFSIHWNWRASAEESVEGIAIDAANFPDETFRTYVQENFDTTADGIFSESEREQVTEIDVRSKGISDLTGVEYFTALKELNCYGNSLKKLDLSQNTALQVLFCESNNLTKLDLSQNTALQRLFCEGNNLTKLDLSQNTALQELRCFNNNLTELDLSQNPALLALWCGENNLTELDVRQNSKLNILYCSNNNLTTLDLSQNIALQQLHCSYNNLTELDVRQNPALQSLVCYGNQLKELDVRQNPALQELYCYNNNLTALDLSQNSELIDLDCSNNTYSIALTGGTFDLSTLPGNFDVSKASNWTNATVDGSILTVTDPKTDVTYTYDLGNGKTATFTLQSTSCTLTESMVEAIPVQSHTGSEVTPDVTLKCGDTILQKDIDYTISYASNVEIGTAKVTITGMGSFMGEITVSFEIGVAIDAKNFPDETFRTYVKEKTPDDILTVSELEQVTQISVPFKGISDLTGVEYFTALKELYCGGNNLTKLDLSQNTALQKLECFNNNLTELDLSQNTALQWLNCSNNNLTELDLRQNTALQELYCSNNNLTELDLRQNTALQELYCSNNNLTELDLRQNTALQTLSCYSNNLTELDLRQNTALEELHCFYNNLTELDLSQNTALQTLSCESNNLTKLDLSQNTALQTLSCYNNNLTELDLSQNTALQELECKNNNLTALDLSQNSELIDLDCSNNTYSIALTGGTFDLSTLPGNFDVSKASNWTNATVDGNTLTVTDLKADVTYTYDCGNEKTATFTLQPTSCILTESMVKEIPEQVYTGSAVTPDVVLQYGEDTLKKDVDYTVSYTNNQHTGTGNAIITGKGTFSGTVTVPFGIGVAINETTFPDENFRTYVKEKFDTTPDDILTVSELEQVIEIDVSSKKISDLTGVEYFTALKKLYCGGNNLTELDVRQNAALQVLSCYDNNLTELDVRQNAALRTLSCESNNLTKLDLSQNTALQWLNCDNNNLTELDLSQNTKLQVLFCESNNLTKLDLSQNTALQELSCYSNNLTELDLRQNTALQTLSCDNNNLTELDLSQNTALQILNCYSNNLTELDLSQNTALAWLNCSDNRYSIDLIGGTFDLNTLPEGFDLSKASNWTNATVDGNTLTVTDLKTDVTYTYDLGNGKTEIFTLVPESCTLTESMVEAIPDQIYTGSELKPEVTWKHGMEGTDYTISYKDNIDAGTATVTITGQEFLEGSITISFTILPADLTDAEIKLKEEKLVYNGTEQSPSIGSITVGDMVLTEDDYTIIGNTATESGTYTLTIQGKGNFTGKATAEWSIVKATPTVTPVLPDQEYIVGDSLPKLGYKCSVDGVITWITNLEKGLIEGENELEWRFTPDDADNYEIVTGTALIVAETTTTTTTTTSTSTTTSTTTTTAKPVTSTTTKTNATTTSTNPTTTSTTKAIATTTATKPITTSTTKAVVTTTATKPVTTSTTKAATTTTATKPVTTSTTKAVVTTTMKPVTTTTTNAVVTTTATKPITTSTTKAIATTTTTKPVTTTTTKAATTTTATKPVTTSTTKAATTTTATKPITTTTTKAVATTTATKPITTTTTKAVATTTATKPITTSTTKAIATTTTTKPITTTTKPVTTIQTTTSTNETTTKATLTTTTAQTTTRTNATTTTTQATTTSTTTNATTTTMHATTATTSTVETTTTTMKPATITTTESTTTNVVTTTMQSTTTTAATTTTTASTTTTTLLTTTSSVVSTTTTPVVTTVPTTTTSETSIVVVPKEADFYFAEDTTTFTPGDLFESITLIQEDGTEVDITDQITLPEVSPSTVETDEQHRAILPVFYQDELLAELTVPVYIGKKGDIDLDGDVTLADATLALTYYSEHAVNNDFYFTTQSAQAPQTEAEQMLEKLMFFLADIDTESKQGADTDNGMIELLDATRILTYYAEQAVGNLPSWSN